MRKKDGQRKFWKRVKGKLGCVLLAALLCLTAAESGCGREAAETETEAVRTAAGQSSGARAGAAEYGEEDTGAGGYGSVQSAERAGEAGGGQERVSADKTEERASVAEAGQENASEAEMEQESASADETGQKLIRTKHITAQTKAFDENLQALEQTVSELNGYVEYSSINGGEEEQSGRYADYTLRIPAGRLDEFSKNLSTALNIIQETEQAEDVTLDYVDIESHIEALETEQESLMKLLEQADSLESILAIQSQLTQVRYELEGYTSRRRVYDNQIDYATVYLSIQEVAREEKEGEGFWTEVGNGISDSSKNLVQGARAAGVFLLGSLPYWLALAAAGAVVWLIVRGILKLCERAAAGRERRIEEELERAVLSGARKEKKGAGTEPEGSGAAPAGQSGEKESGKKETGEARETGQSKEEKAEERGKEPEGREE